MNSLLQMTDKGRGGPKRKYEPPVPTDIGKRKKGSRGVESASKLPTGNFYLYSFNLTSLLVTPVVRCRLKLLKSERIKDYLLMEIEFIQNQERLKPQKRRNTREQKLVDQLRGAPMKSGTLEEVIDAQHAIVKTVSLFIHYILNCLERRQRDVRLHVFVRRQGSVETRIDSFA